MSLKLVYNFILDVPGEINEKNSDTSLANPSFSQLIMLQSFATDQMKLVPLPNGAMYSITSINVLGPANGILWSTWSLGKGRGGGELGALYEKQKILI